MAQPCPSLPDKRRKPRAVVNLSLTHQPALRRAGAFRPSSYHLSDTRSGAEPTDKLFVSQTFFSGPAPQIQLLADLMPEQGTRLIRQGGDQRELRRPAPSPAAGLLCGVSLKDFFFKTTKPKATKTNPKPPSNTAPLAKGQ